jgi:HK97 family phage portal protein
MRLLPFRREAPAPDPPWIPPDTWTGSIMDWATLFGLGWSPVLAERVWVANRCMQLCAQQIASMPLRFYGAPSSSEPAWLAAPDPVWYPNGIGDAVFSIVWSQLGWGDAFLYITDRYADGYPALWTVLDPATMTVQTDQGRRTYRAAGTQLDPDDVVQISRDPRGKLKGTSALSAYASQLWGTIAAGETGRMMVSGGGIPNAVLKSKRKLTGPQAQALQQQWMDARARAGIGTPAVLPPEIDFEQLSFSASDLALLDLQEFDAKAIASAFSIPAMMLNLELRGSLVYQNPEQLYEVWWRSELRPFAGRVQRALSANMLPRGSWVEFDARAILAPTFQDQVTAWTQLVKEGIVTINEMRAAILHLPPVEAGEALQDLTEPPTASASPAGGGGETVEEAVVTELRPTVMVT